MALFAVDHFRPFPIGPVGQLPEVGVGILGSRLGGPGPVFRPGNEDGLAVHLGPLEVGHRLESHDLLHDGVVLDPLHPLLIPLQGGLEHLSARLGPERPHGGQGEKGTQEED